MLELAAIRQNRGISLEQISETTKISVRSLTAVENCDFARLPGGIYTTSYIRQYARAIDYDEVEILEVYYRSIKAAASSLERKDAGQGGVPGFRAASDIAS
jgi:cytoskeleton protein RodZ